ncbi:hypothetical protein H4Q26_001856 [Puccinia striiformis f. sp. tritici PST-130]|nr:hypothetical protein H4Q26_001856 [Puccinia striiformis f. sp. tritici PST-130]
MLDSFVVDRSWKVVMEKFIVPLGHRWKGGLKVSGEHLLSESRLPAIDRDTMRAAGL